MNANKFLGLRPAVEMIFSRRFSNCFGPRIRKKGLILGVYDGCAPGEYKLTSAASKFDAEMCGRLREVLKGSGITLGKAQVYNNFGCEFYAVAVAGLGKDGVSYNRSENINECKENVRIAASVGARALQDMGVTDIMVEGLSNAEAAAEGAALAVWRFQDYRDINHRRTTSQVCLYDDQDTDGWERGIQKAEAQNIARKLEDTPANFMTPEIFTREAMEILCPCNVSVQVRQRDWLEEKCWTGFLSVARGSCGPPLVLEIAYCGSGQDDKLIVMIGKGSTFDSGGLCLKRSCEDMSELRGDMAGAAVIVATIKALANLNIPINVNALIPLIENMPGGMAPKPGDVFASLSGKSVRLEDTAQGAKLSLADALSYAAVYKPCLAITVGTLTGGIRTALGASSTGVFSTSDIAWEELCKAGAESGDRVWRLPLWKYFASKVTDDPAVDVRNVGKGRGGDPCTGAAFLMGFAPQSDFVHLDITGTGMVSSGDLPYMREGTMSGRPTRTLVQFLYQMACPEFLTRTCVSSSSS